MPPPPIKTQKRRSNRTTSAGQTVGLPWLILINNDFLLKKFGNRRLFLHPCKKNVIAILLYGGLLLAHNVWLLKKEIKEINK